MASEDWEYSHMYYYSLYLLSLLKLCSVIHHPLSYYMKEQLRHSAKRHLLCFRKKIKLIWNDMRRKWWHNFHFWLLLPLQQRTCWSLNVFCTPQWHSWTGVRERECAQFPVTFLLWTWTSDFTDLDQRGIVRERDEEKETKRIERGRGFFIKGKKKSHVCRMCFMTAFNMKSVC